MRAALPHLAQAISRPSVPQLETNWSVSRLIVTDSGIFAMMELYQALFVFNPPIMKLTFHRRESEIRGHVRATRKS